MKRSFGVILQHAVATKDASELRREASFKRMRIIRVPKVGLDVYTRAKGFLDFIPKDPSSGPSNFHEHEAEALNGLRGYQE